MTDNEFILTLDVDWAPDSVIRHVASVLQERGVKATWFISHDSTAVRELLRWPDFEAGLHPNYLPGSSQGSSTHEVLETLLRIVPDAVSVRSHAIVQSGPLLNHYVEHTSLKIDSTIFLPEMPNIQPVRHLSLGGSLLRVPFFWADDYEMCKHPPQWNMEQYIEVPGLKVMMFHPIHVALNSPDFAFYQGFKERCPNVTQLSETEINSQLCRNGKGAGDFFRSLVGYLSKRKSRVLCDLRIYG